MSRNEAAELLRGYLSTADLAVNEDDLDEALATERRLTVERLRQGLEAIRDTSTDPASRQLAESMLADLATADVDGEEGK